NDPVCLVLKTSLDDFTTSLRSFRHLFRHRFGTTSDALARLLQHVPDPASVVLINEELSEEQLYALHLLGDCYVSLCRSEGWGMGAYEAAWLGKPIVMTGFGGQRAYLPPEYSYLVDYNLVPAHDSLVGTSYSPDQMWADPHLTHAATLMRSV